jgi:hypothetical protein
MVKKNNNSIGSAKPLPRVPNINLESVRQKKN